MVRNLVLAIAFFSLVGVAQDSSAITISRNNPYRSFNVTGYNYGSVQWEKQHGKSEKSWSATNRSRRFFRR
jgi:hypothetical protein